MTQQQTNQPIVAISCPTCRKMVPADSHWCGHCQARIKKQCAQCGLWSKEEHKICGRCGDVFGQQKFTFDDVLKQKSQADLLGRLIGQADWLYEDHEFSVHRIETLEGDIQKACIKKIIRRTCMLGLVVILAGGVWIAIHSIIAAIVEGVLVWLFWRALGNLPGVLATMWRAHLIEDRLREEADGYKKAVIELQRKININERKQRRINEDGAEDKAQVTPDPDPDPDSIFSVDFTDDSDFSVDFTDDSDVGTGRNGAEDKAQVTI